MPSLYDVLNPLPNPIMNPSYWEPLKALQASPFPMPSPHGTGMWGQPLPAPSMAPSGWWNALPAEQEAIAPPIPQTPSMPTGMVPAGPRSWLMNIPFNDAVQAPDEAPGAPPPGQKTMYAGIPGAAESAPAPAMAASTPTAGYEPDWRMLALRLGLQAMQPIQPGQTVAGRIGEVGLGGIDWLEAQRRMKFQETRQSKKDVLDERQVGAAEKQVEIATRKETREAKKEAALTPAEAELKKAQADEARAKGELYGRSAGRGSAGQPRTKEDLRSAMIKKLDLTMADPKELSQIKANIDYFVEQSGLPSAAETAKTSSKPWPKTAAEAIKEIKTANKGQLSPSQKLQIETELKKRYPDYKIGSFN